MNDTCKCKLPYVISGIDTCERCNKRQTMFHGKPISKIRKFNGTEFKRGDIVESIGETYACLVEIKGYTKTGAYRVMVPNGCFEHTRKLGDKVR